MADFIDQLLKKDPETIFIDLNDNWGLYESIEEYEKRPYVRWMSGNQRELSIASNRLWSLRVTEKVYLAHDLFELAEYVGRVLHLSIEDEDYFTTINYMIEISKNIKTNFSLQYVKNKDDYHWNGYWYPTTPIGFYSFGDNEYRNVLDNLDNMIDND